MFALRTAADIQLRRQRLAEELWNTDQDAMGIPTDKRQKLDPEEMSDSVLYRLDTLGYRVGFGVVERFATQTPFPCVVSTIKALTLTIPPTTTA